MAKPRNVAKTQRPMIDNDDTESKGPGLTRLRELFDRSPVALTLADTSQDDAPLILANSAFLDLTGYREHEVIGRNCRFLQSDLENAEQRAEVREVMRRQGQGQVVFRNRRKNGEPFDNMLFLQALVERDRGTRYFLGSQFLLDRRTTESQIDRHMHQLDVAVARAVESTASLHAEQRRMVAQAAHAVATAWLALGS